MNLGKGSLLLKCFVDENENLYATSKVPKSDLLGIGNYVYCHLTY